MYHLADHTLGAFVPTWQQIKLFILFGQLFVCTEYKNLILFHDNATADLASALLQHVDIPHHHHVVIVYNIDVDAGGLTSSNNAAADSNHRPRLSAANFAHSVSIDLFANHEALRVYRYRVAILRLRVQTKWIRIYLKPLRSNFVNTYRNMVVVELRPATNDLHISAFNYQRRETLRLFSDSPLSMYAQLFRDDLIDMRGQPLYMWGHMDVPNLFRARAFHKNSDGSGRGERHGVAGFYPAVCALIGRYFNASIAFVTFEESANVDDEVDLYADYTRLRRREYRVNEVMPGVKVHMSTSANTIKTTTAIEQQIRPAIKPYDLYDEFRAIGHAMYPHRQENYVVLVPYQRRENGGRSLWLVLVASPLTAIWATAIALMVVVRYAVRIAEQRIKEPMIRGGGLVKLSSSLLPWSDVDEIVLETCGMSFGWSIRTQRVWGRAERILLMGLCVFSIVSGVFCSGLLLQQFTFAGEKAAVNTLQELNALKNITIVLPFGLGVDESMWNRNQ